MNRKTENFLPLPHYYAHFQKVSIFLHYGTAQMHRFGKCTIFMHNQAEKCGEMWHKTIPLLFCRKAYFVSTKILKRLSLGKNTWVWKWKKPWKGLIWFSTQYAQKSQTLVETLGIPFVVRMGHQGFQLQTLQNS